MLIHVPNFEKNKKIHLYIIFTQLMDRCLRVTDMYDHYTRARHVKESAYNICI